MATLSYNRLTLLEHAKRLDPTSTKLLPIVEQLTWIESFFAVMPMVESNGFNMHKIVRRTSNPTGTWVGYNEGITQEVSGTEPLEEPLAMLNARSTPDMNMIDDSPDPKGLRMSEAKSFIQGLGQNIVTTAIYGNRASDTKEFTGLAPRLGTINAKTIIDGGGTGSDLSSIYAIVPGPDTFFMLTPRDSQTGPNADMGIRHQDMGKRLIADASSNDYWAYVDEFTAKIGMCVRDPRTVGRYANIETSGAANIFDYEKLITLLNQMRGLGEGVMLMMNRTILTQIELSMVDKANVMLRYDEAFGRKGVPMFKGFPIIITDAIVDTESAITS
jgi:hypothetical protein